MTSGANDAIPVKELAIWYEQGIIRPAEISDQTLALIKAYNIALFECKAEQQRELETQKRIAGVK
jgi:hypothetical protein